MTREGLVWQAAVILLGSFGLSASASALEPLGLYVGASVGSAKLKANSNYLPAGGADFDDSDHAYKLFAGIRPLSVIGAEFSYEDYGSPSQSLLGGTSTANPHGVSLSGLVYAPIPLPYLDIFGRFGYSRFDAMLNLPGVQVKLDGHGMRYGLGAQLKFSSWALRGEYEVIDATRREFRLMTVGFSKTFF